MDFESLNETEREWFVDLRAALERRGVWDEADELALAELVVTRRLQAESLALLREGGREVRGSRGQPVKNPRLDEFLALGGRASALSRDLLLSPRARKTAGVSEVKADVDDPLDAILGPD